MANQTATKSNVVNQGVGGGIPLNFVDQLDGTYAEKVVATLSAGTIEIGEVAIDQDTPGTTNAVSIAQLGATTVSTGHGTSNAGTLRVELPTDGTGVVGLNAGSSIIGNVRVDQTTPGTTNGVAVNRFTGAANYANGQVTAGVASGVLVAARATRRSVVVRNQDDADSIYIGAGTVTSGNGLLLKAGESISIDSTAAINCIRDTGDCAVGYFETYDT